LPAPTVRFALPSALLLLLSLCSLLSDRVFLSTNTFAVVFFAAENARAMAGTRTAACLTEESMVGRGYTARGPV
jgi:hypothetical protein